MRRGQSLVECAVCLPFLLLLIGAMVEFGLFLHTRQVLWGVARAGALELSRVENEPDRESLSRIRRRMLFLGESVDLELQDIFVGPIVDQPGFYRVHLRSRHRGLAPNGWLSANGGWVRAQLVVPVEGGA